ncbi:MAG: two-component system, sensor histidine kinase PdtaS, partial [Pseudonocardiales bacterium]|nr:two-component system, sensor histidine kinase PdtaS [Pseudonocardiales bacterium]
MRAATRNGGSERVSTLSDLLAEHTHLPGDAVDHLQRVVAEWQLLADMSFADFLLWIPLPQDADQSMTSAPVEFLCVAQARPTTGPTAHPEDTVTQRVSPQDNPQLRRAVVEGRICREEEPRWNLEVPVRRETIPVRFNGRVLAVLSRDTNLAMPRVPSPMEIAYLGCASDLCQMIADGTFPSPSAVAGADTSPRAGDGMIRLDAHGLVAYASPNALSAYHRMGHASDLVGLPLGAATKQLVGDPFDAVEVASRIQAALDGRTSMRMEVRARGATMLVRALPLRPRGDAAGALVLVRDITDLRRRDQALLTKDATIREIHHRVKNNLQTVAALLRLQARRVSVPQARAA